jgi:uncharacterized protein YhfF
MDSRSKAFLDEYLASLPTAKREAATSFSAEYFCAEREAANTCAELVRAGIKVATCSLKHWYLSSVLPMPRVGHLMVVTDWEGEPSTIIEITSVSESRFCDVGEDFAFSEGEGDRSLSYWRRTHWAFFEKECAEIDLVLSEEISLVLERFKVVYSADDRGQSQ